MMWRTSDPGADAPGYVRSPLRGSWNRPRSVVKPGSRGDEVAPPTRGIAVIVPECSGPQILDHSTGGYLLTPSLFQPRVEQRFQTKWAIVLGNPSRRR